MCVFFDVDGVLIDGWHADTARRKPWDATIEADLGIDRAGFQRLLFGAPDGRPSPMAECIAGRRDLRAALDEILPQLGHHGPADVVMRYWFEKDSNVNPEVLQLVADIRERGVARVYLATGQEHHRAHHLWTTLGLRDRFDGMFYTAAIGVAKSDRRFFRAIDRALVSDPTQPPMFFDDQPGIVAVAVAAGWDATIFTSARDVREHPRLRHLWV
ncbi:MAG: HAD family hydrolase [Alphaproteobacteria bacterium]